MTDDQLKAIWHDLSAPFAPEDLEWRVQSAGFKQGDQIWCKVLCYVTSRAIMERLDSVLGPENWWNEQPQCTGAGVVQGITLRLPDGQIITKWDGAGNTDVEPVKGGISGALKRAAVLFGIGRYLYALKDTWGHVNEDGSEFGSFRDKKSDRKIRFRWDPPPLPRWALPDGYTLQEKPIGQANGRNGAHRPTSQPASKSSADPLSDKIAWIRGCNDVDALYSAHEKLIAKRGDGTYGEEQVRRLVGEIAKQMADVAKPQTQLGNVASWIMEWSDDKQMDGDDAKQLLTKCAERTTEHAVEA